MRWCHCLYSKRVSCCHWKKDTKRHQADDCSAPSDDPQVEGRTSGRHRSDVEMISRRLFFVSQWTEARNTYCNKQQQQQKPLNECVGDFYLSTATPLSPAPCDMISHVILTHYLEAVAMVITHSVGRRTLLSSWCNIITVAHIGGWLSPLPAHTHTRYGDLWSDLLICPTLSFITVEKQETAFFYWTPGHFCF